jgi:hypothetical protein
MAAQYRRFFEASSVLDQDGIRKGGRVEQQDWPLP